MAGRRYVRDNRGRFASVGATARGGRLRTEAGNKRATQTERIAGSKPSGTIGKNRSVKPAARQAAKPAAQKRRGNTTLAKLASPELRSLSQDRKIGYRELGNRKINRLMTAVRLENLTKAGKLDNYSPSQHRRAQSIHNEAGYTLRASGGIGQDRRSVTRAIRADRQRRAKTN